MKFTPSSPLVKRSLSGHSWIGLFAGWLVYLVCLTGTLAVFSDEFKRWEQPYADEYLGHDPNVIEKAVNDFALSHTVTDQNLSVLLPTPTLPRTTISSPSPTLSDEYRTWLIDADGSIGVQTSSEWTDMLLYLHYYLHLPTTYGEIVVSIVGILLLALIVAGFFAHPLIFRDAFHLRFTGFQRLKQADIHNRLSVWGAPFHLMIAVTGAFFGLAFVLLPIIADAFYGGDLPAVEDSVFGQAPHLQQQARPMAVAAALESVKSIAPQATPTRITVIDVGGSGQYLTISATHPQRLVYEENYLFDSSGTFLFSQGYSDGAIGKQIVHSAYRLHFGYFGGFPVKIVYGILGLALTVVSVTGVNVWLARRKTRDYLNSLWAGLVWGTPAAFALTALAQVIFGIPPKGIFWAILIAAISLCLWLRDHRKGEKLLQGICALSLGALFTAHFLIFGGDAFGPAALGMNLAIIITGALMGLLAVKKDPFFASEELARQS